MGVKNFIMKRIPFCKMKAKRKYREFILKVDKNIFRSCEIFRFYIHWQKNLNTQKKHLQ